MNQQCIKKSPFFGYLSSSSMRRGYSASSRVARRPAVDIRNENVLIVNTKGGGHAFLGLHLAKKLISSGHNVTILNDGDQGKLAAKTPFSEYGSTGASVVWGSPTDVSRYPSGPFDVVYDNNGKDLQTCQPLIDHFKSVGGLKHYVYVSSAGAYVPNDIEPLHVEGDARKSKAGHVAVENYLADSGLPWTVFQPQYIYGPYTAKDCEQWYMERILRERPVPIPGPGVQLTSISHVEDLADMMAKVPGCSAAVNEHFNLVGDRCYTLDGIARIIGDAAGKSVKIVHYDPKSVDAPKGKGFPFRTVHFFSSSDKAKRILGWKPKHTFVEDVAERLKEFQESGRLEKSYDFSVDDMCISAAGN